MTIGIVSEMADGLIAWASNAFDLKTDSSVTALLIVVLFGVGTDYILFFMFRYRERLRAGDAPRDAVAVAVTRAGEAIASAAGAVIVAFMALSLSTLGLFRSLGPSLAIAVAVTLLAGLTLIPAIVALLGTRVFWPSKAWRTEPRAARFAAIGRSMGAHPARFAAVSGIVMAALAVAAFSFHPTFDLSSGSTSSTAEIHCLAERTAARRAGRCDRADPRSTCSPPTARGWTRPANWPPTAPTLAKVSGVGSVSAALPNAKGTVAVYEVTLSASPASSTAMDTVKGPLRGTAHEQAPQGTSALVGGETAIFVDIQAGGGPRLRGRLSGRRAAHHAHPGAGAARGGRAALPDGLGRLGFGATLGATVLLFQHSGGNDGLIFILPVIMYMFVVALGTDYNILMITRLREEARAGRTPREAAAEAVRHAGPTIGAAGLILAGSFASLMLAGQSILTQMGFAISAGIAMAAFVMAMFFTPALTALVGHAAWWPGHADARTEGAADHTAAIDGVADDGVAVDGVASRPRVGSIATKTTSPNARPKARLGSTAPPTPRGAPETRAAGERPPRTSSRERAFVAERAPGQPCVGMVWGPVGTVGAGLLATCCCMARNSWATVARCSCRLRAG